VSPLRRDLLRRASFIPMRIGRTLIAELVASLRSSVVPCDVMLRTVDVGECRRAREGRGLGARWRGSRARAVMVVAKKLRGYPPLPSTIPLTCQVRVRASQASEMLDTCTRMRSTFLCTRTTLGGKR